MILVAGGAGYIGSHCVYELISRGREVVVADNLQTGHAGAVHPHAHFCRGDIRDADFLDGVFNAYNIDSVIHFAANSLVGVSMEKPLEYYSNNVHGTEILLDAMRSHGVKNIVFSSTAAVYGEAKSEFITENEPTEPTNTYGETKLAIEKMMKWCERAYGIKYTALRYFNVAGAGFGGAIGEDHNPETHLIPLVLRVPAGKSDCINIYGTDYPTPDGTCVRDYIHITDLISAHILALDRLADGGESDIFNLGSSSGFSVLEIIEAARSVTSRPIPAKSAPRRAGDPARLIACADKAKTVLGWKPEHTDINSIISSAWKWHEIHPDGFAEDK